MYTDTNTYIQPRNKSINKIYMSQGVIQGCSLCPILFHLFLTTLLDTGHYAGRVIHLTRERASILLFADDQVLLAGSDNQLQQLLCSLSKLNLWLSMENSP
jgi:hypothetical protein